MWESGGYVHSIFLYKFCKNELKNSNFVFFFFFKIFSILTLLRCTEDLSMLSLPLAMVFSLRSGLFNMVNSEATVRQKVMG